jgi:hypothetical protein
MCTLHGSHIWSEVSSSEFEPVKLVDQNAVAQVRYKGILHGERGAHQVFVLWLGYAACPVANHGLCEGQVWRS